MSLSKGKLPEATAEPPRQPKCTRCRHHGILIPQKGHVRFCPFQDCACPKCLLVTERTRITAMQRSLRRAGENKPKPGENKPKPRENKPKPREKRRYARTGRGEAEPAAAGACGAAGPVGGARAQPTFHAAGSPERARSPLDLRTGPAAGGQQAAGPDVQRVASPEARGADAAINVPCFGELRPSAPVHFVHVPLRMSGHYPSGCASYPAIMIHMPCLPPVPAELYNHGLYRRLMVPHVQHDAVHFPPPADCKPVLLTEASQEELMPAQPPKPPLATQADLDIVGLD